jgi:excisionase family DNA binding protein
MDEFLTTNQAARALGLHRSTVLRLVDEGQLEAVVYRYATRPTIRIPQRSIDEFRTRYVSQQPTPPPRRSDD